MTEFGKFAIGRKLRILYCRIGVFACLPHSGTDAVPACTPSNGLALLSPFGISPSTTRGSGGGAAVAGCGLRRERGPYGVTLSYVSTTSISLECSICTYSGARWRSEITVSTASSPARCTIAARPNFV